MSLLPSFAIELSRAWGKNLVLGFAPEARAIADDELDDAKPHPKQQIPLERDLSNGQSRAGIHCFHERSAIDGFLSAAHEGT